MANRNGNTLNRLIKEHAYLAGSLPAIQLKIDVLRSSLEASIERLNKGNDRLVELGNMISEMSEINLAEIREIKANTRRSNGAHGSIRRELIRVLQSADKPLSSGALVQYMAELFGYPMTTVEERIRARDMVRRPLNIFRTHGAVIRHPSIDGSTQGRWEWVKGTEYDQP